MDTSTYKATMEDGTVHEMVSDQRDIAKWEIQPFGTSWVEATNKIFTYSRFCAWSAGRRAKLFTMSFDEFSERCVEVTLISEEEAPDPGNPVASAGS